MTSPVPGWIAWPVIILMIVTIAIRFTLLNVNMVDRLTNQSLVFGTIGIVLREGTVQEGIEKLPGILGDVALLEQVSFCCIVIIVQAIYGMARAWGGADPGTARSRQRLYYAVGVVLSGVILVAGTPSRRAGLLIDEYLGWPAVVVWVAFYAPIFVAALLVIRVFGREARQSDTTARERSLYILTLVIAVGLLVDAVLSPLITISEVLSGTGSGDPNMEIKAWTFFIAVAGSLVVGAVPVIAALRFQFGQDRISRNLRQIEGLWRDLTEQFPDVRRGLDDERADPAWRLHRRIIEIYDALLRLSRWNDGANGKNRSSELNASVAVEIANAYAAKVRGEEPLTDYSMLLLLAARPETQDLTATSDELLAVARSWSSLRDRYMV